MKKNNLNLVTLGGGGGSETVLREGKNCLLRQFEFPAQTI